MAPKPKPLLDLAMRRRLFELVQAYPGLHMREAARQLGTSSALVTFHCAVLEEHGLLTLERTERNMRMYAARGPSRPSGEERELLAVLRNQRMLHMVLVMLQAGQPVKNGELAAATGLSKSHVTFYATKLIERGMLARDAEGLFYLRQPRQVAQLLTRFRPTPDLLQRFEDVWNGFYGL